MDPGQDGYDVMSGIDDLEGPPGVVEPLKAAFKRKTEPGGGWTAHRTAADGAGVASYFVQWIVAAHPGVTAMQDITVEVWQAWQAWRASSLSSRKSGVAFMRALLLEVEDLPEPTVEAVRGRRRFAPNSDADEQAFRDVSWRVAVSAITRIGGNAERMARYRAGETPADDVRVRIAGREWSGDELLDYVFRHGALPGRLGRGVEQLRSALKVPRGIPYTAAIFPIQGESAALQFLFVLEGGYSPLALRGLKVGDFGTERREDTAALAAEAAAIRFGTPDAAETLQAKRETLHQIAEFIGRPARDWLAAHGDPTDALFVAYGRPIRSASAASQFTTDWSQVNRQVAARSWTRLTGVTAGDGSIPSVMRLRAGGPPLGERRLLVRVETDAGIEVYDFSDLAYLPSQWVEPLCAAFCRLAGPGGEWRAKDIVLAGSGILRRIARELPATNPGLTTIADITKEIWGRWRDSDIAGPAGSRAAVDLAQSLLQEAGWLGAADAALSSRPTAATLPDPGWRPAELTGEGGLHGRMPGGDGLTWDFRAVPAPLGLKEPIAAVFAQKAGIGGTWKSPHTVKGHEGSVKRFLRSFAAVNPNIATIEDVTAEAWWRWLGEGHAGRSPSRADVRLMRALLTDLDGLRETTRQALTSRRIPPREPSGVTSYDAKETKALSTTAARDVRAAARRIGTNLDTRDLYRRGEEPADAVRVRIAGKDWSAGELLHHQSLNGTMPGYWDTARGDVVREMLGLAEGQRYGDALFLNSTEMFSLQMLFVIEGGYNDSTLTAMTIGNFRADDRESDPPVEIREHDKPRRGSRRFFSETLMGDLQKLEELAEWITQPGRDALAALGYPTDALWVGISTGGLSGHPSRRFISGSGWSKDKSELARRWSERTGVTDNTGEHPRMQRLRRTNQVIQRKPMGNTQETHDTEYVIPDPRTSEHARDTLPRIQQRIIGNAKENVKENEHRMRVLGPAEAAAAPPSQDTAVVACSDISHSPFAEPGELCPVSLRTCFTCPNSYMGPRHLPRVITYISEMKATTRHLPAEEWQDTHADTYTTLQDAIEQFTEAELNEARDSVTAEDVAVVRNVLRLP